MGAEPQCSGQGTRLDCGQPGVHLWRHIRCPGPCQELIPSCTTAVTPKHRQVWLKTTPGGLLHSPSFRRKLVLALPTFPVELSPELHRRLAVCTELPDLEICWHMRTRAEPASPQIGNCTPLGHTDHTGQVGRGTPEVAQPSTARHQPRG